MSLVRQIPRSIGPLSRGIYRPAMSSVAGGSQSFQTQQARSGVPLRRSDCLNSAELEAYKMGAAKQAFADVLANRNDPSTLSTSPGNQLLDIFYAADGSRAPFPSAIDLAGQSPSEGEYAMGDNQHPSTEMSATPVPTSNITIIGIQPRSSSIRPAHSSFRPAQSASWRSPRFLGEERRLLSSTAGAPRSDDSFRRERRALMTLHPNARFFTPNVRPVRPASSAPSVPVASSIQSRTPMVIALLVTPPYNPSHTAGFSSSPSVLRVGSPAHSQSFQPPDGWKSSPNGSVKFF